MFSLLLIFSVVIHFLEKDLQPEAFGNILDSMWYGIATLTTVGYGDVTPVSDLGKLISSFAMFLGIAMFALPAAILASAYYEVGSGDYFGETGLISQAERNATISVLEEAKLLKLSKESLDELTEEYPALFEDLKQSAADRTG